MGIGNNQNPQHKNLYSKNNLSTYYILMDIGGDFNG
jgi:hypothetical protein